jgi:ubiquinone/menaquinone biosynthesis C-methylase UbiE
VTLPSTPFVAYSLEEVWLPVSENILAWEQDFHQLMLDDQIRMRAYQRAIQEAVQPGMIVLDLGTGTGILGLWALQAGAAHLYAIDVNAAVIPKAIAAFEGGGFAGKFDVFQGFSYDINLPRPADLVISEIIGNLGDNEDFIPILTDARKRFLKPSGRMLPLRVRSELVPVSSTKAHQQVAAKHCRALNANYRLGELMRRLAVESAFNLYYDAIIPRARYLSEPRVAREFLFDGNDQPVYETELAFPVTGDGTFTGFKGSFVAELSASVRLDISGDDIAARTTSDSWKHCYLPIENPIAVKQGDHIELRYARSYPSLRDSPFRQCYRWAGAVTRAGEVVGRFDQSTGEQELNSSKC